MFSYKAHHTGVISELKAQQYFIEQDYDVFIPVHGKTRADFIAVKGNSVLRVQVKTAQYNSEYIQSRLDISGTRYSEADCDILVFVLDNKMWVAPISEISGVSSVCLGKKNDDPTYKPRKGYDPRRWRVH